MGGKCRALEYPAPAGTALWAAAPLRAAQPEHGWRRGHRQIAVPLRAEGSHGGGCLKIRTIIVEDEPLARERLRGLLEADPEIEVIAECADGREAVKQIREQAPDLIFLDVQLPELDGFGVLAELGAGPLPGVVFVTAYDKFALKDR